MKNKIVFTQDLPGERKWLLSKFPGHITLETEFGGLWPTTPFANNANTLWEIPPDSCIDVSNIACEKYKSLYQLDKIFISGRWCESTHLLMNNQNFLPQPRAEKAQVLHFARSGTVFLESILYKKCNYKKTWYDHTWMGGDDQALLNVLHTDRPDLFLCYRSDWWGWATSIVIAKRFGYYHWSNHIEWDQLEPFEVSTNDLDQLISPVRANWQALCHMRTHFPYLNFYITEFSQLIKNSHLTDHQAIKYDKKRLIANYDQIKTVFDASYLPTFQLWEKNSVNHLLTMNCELITNFDKFIS